MLAESSNESFVASSVEVPLSQMTSDSNPPPAPSRTFTEEEKKKVKDDITEMNLRFTQHGYEAFVHNRMHLIFKVYPFDLN